MEQYGRMAEDRLLAAQATLMSALPLRIDAADLQNPTLLLSGDGWSLSATCDWRWCREQGQVDGSTPDATDRIWDFVGDELTAIAWTAERGFGLDPRFSLRSSGSLELLSDAPFDTWIIHLPTIVLVGPLNS